MEYVILHTILGIGALIAIIWVYFYDKKKAKVQD